MLTYSDKTTLDVDRYRQVVEINLYGSVYVAKYASIIMAKNKAYNDR